MLSNRPSRLTARIAAGAAVLGTAGALLVGCGNDRSSFVSAANSDCTKYQQRLDGKALPKTTRQGIDYALNYFTDLDLAVSALNEISLPHGEAAEIRSRWLDPAKQSLSDFRTNLQIIRKASLSGDAATVDRQLDELRHLGSKGVDASYLKSLGVSACLPLFGTPA